MSEPSAPRRASLLSGSFLDGRLTLTVQPVFLLLAILLGAFAAEGDAALTACAAAIVAVSVLVHELGHAAACLIFGSPADVVLNGFGGLTRPRRGADFRAWQRVVMTAAGPGAGLLLAVVCTRSAAVAWAARLAGSPRVFFLAFYAARVNLVWSLFNLLPVSPLDGGHLLATLLRARFGLAGLRAAHAAGAAVAGLAALGALALGELYNAALIGALCAGEVRSWRRARTFTEADLDESLLGELSAAQGDWREGRRQQALRRLVRLRRRGAGGLVHRAASEQLALFLFSRGNHRAAYALLKPLDEGELSGGGRLALQQLALAHGDYETSIRLGQTNFHDRPDARVAAVIAQACAGLGDARRALQWLSTAVRRGLPDAASVLRDPAFDRVRGDPDFADFERSLREGR